MARDSSILSIGQRRQVENDDGAIIEDDLVVAEQRGRARTTAQEEVPSSVPSVGAK